jgi:nucleotide-binding universal stress UspA family protein
MPEEAWTSRLVVRNILCPVDFSEFSSRAVRYASEIARHFGARLTVQHTVPVPTTPIPEGLEVITPEEMLRASREEAAKRLGSLLSQSGTENTELLVKVNSGDVKDHIVRTVAEDNIDLVVMGTHGHKGFSRLVLGSTTEQIIHEVVFCPVLVVSRPQAGFLAHHTAQPPQWKTILAPVDFSADSGRSLTHALRWAAEWNAKVILFHAVEDPPPRMHGMIDLLPEFNPYFDKEVAEAWERIQAVIPEAARERCELHYEVRQGKPREEILKYAAEVNPDLIVMGSRGNGKSSVVWGSTISGVMRDGRYPVLAIRHLYD